MKAFARLHRVLDAAGAPDARQAALQAYLRAAAPADAAWAVYFLSGGRLRRLPARPALLALARSRIALPPWLFDECHRAVGDLAETVALLLPPAATPVERTLADWVERHLLALQGLGTSAASERLLAQWHELPADERVLAFKLVSGGLRPGVARQPLAQALAAVSGVDARTLAQRLAGWTAAHPRPDAQAYAALVAPGPATGHAYPFLAARPLAQDPAAPEQPLGAIGDWLIDWHWDGPPVQLVRRGDAAVLWSALDELLSEHHPGLIDAARALPPGCVIQGHLAAHPGQRAQPRALLAQDLLEADGADLRGQPPGARRERLAALLADCAHPLLRLSPMPAPADWPAAAALRGPARPPLALGLLLRRATDNADGGWLWLPAPHRVNAVLVYAERGRGGRAAGYGGYSFALWSGPPGAPGRELLVIARADAGLDDAERAELDARIRLTTLERFGPVHRVQPTLVYELAVEGVTHSPRRKAGLAARAARLLRARPDLAVDEADTVQDLRDQALPEASSAAGPGASIGRFQHD